MKYNMNQNTCKAYLTTEDFFSCNNFGITKLFYSDVGTPLHIDSSCRGAHYALALTKESFENNGYTKYLTHMQNLVTNYTSASVTKHAEHKQSFPKTFHAVWITKITQPKAISDTDIKNFLQQASKFNGYDIAIWSNIDPNILLELNPQLASTKVIVKNIATLSTKYSSLLDAVISPEKYISHKTVNCYKGAIIDLAKYLIMESEGSILADFNFKFDNNFNPDKITHYDFVAKSAGGWNIIENSFFSATPHHPIFKDTLDMMEEMLVNPSCSNRILKNNIYNPTQVVNHFSMLPLAMAYLKYSNKDGNVDVLFPCRTNPHKNAPFPPELIEKLHAHEELAYQLNSDSLEGIGDFAMSYCLLSDELWKYHSYNCIDSGLVGHDQMSLSWWC